MAVDAVATDWQWMLADGSPGIPPVNLHVRRGDRILLRGRSGAGKSTLLAGLAGLLDESLGCERGHLVVGGAHPREARGLAGLVLQDPLSQTVMERVGDDVAFGLENLGVPREDMAERIRESLDMVGLDVGLGAATQELSGGQRQRLALAGVLAMRPALLLLDEPTANLDPDGAVLIRDSVHRAVERYGLTLIVVDHSPDLWQSVVTRTVTLTGDGIAEGSPSKNERFLAPEHSRRNVAMHEGPVLRAVDLAVGYPAGVIAQRNLSFDVHAGSVLAVTGPNGSGKSALALTLGGLIPPREGRIDAAATLQPPRGQIHTWKARDLASRVGSVFQTPEHQFIGTTVRSDIARGAVIDADVEKMLTNFGLQHLAERSPFDLSGGEKRRVSIADVVVMRPKVLILDEPTFGLDDIAWRELGRLLLSLADDGMAIVMVSHDDQFVDAIAHQRLRLGVAGQPKDMATQSHSESLGP